MATNNAVNLTQLKKSVFNMKNYIDKSLPDADKYLNERIVEKDIDSLHPEYETVAGSNNNKQCIYNFDITGKHSDTMAVVCELSINTTTTVYITSAKIVENYETNNSAVSLPTIHIFDDSTGTEIAMCYVGLRATKIVNSEGKIDMTTRQYNSAFIQFARSDEYIKNDTNNLYSKGFKLKVKFYDISNNYVGDVYHIPYNLKNGKGSSLYQETCQISDDATNSLVMGYKSTCNTSNTINIGYNCASNGSGVMVAASSTINSNASYLFGTGCTIDRMYSMAVGMGLTIPKANNNKGSMIIGTGGTLATDSLFAISTAKINKNSSDCNDIRYPFEVKTNNDVYLRGSNLILETGNDPSQDNHLITKKYVDTKVAGIVNSAPETLDTLKELATALGNDPNFATTVATQIGNKVDKVDGMSLTHNDLTNDLKANYDVAYAYSQATHSYNDLTDKPTIPSIDGLATKNNPVFVNSISLGREQDSTIGINSTAVGDSVIASGEYSHAEGFACEALGNGSHAEGDTCTASGEASHAEGAGSEAIGAFSHAENYSFAEGKNSHAEGHWNYASSENQHVQGKFNIKDTAGKYAHIVGNGKNNNSRSNAHTLDWSGNGWFAGKVTQEGSPVDNKDLTTKKYVDDKVAGIVVPTKTSELTNDSNYLTEHQSLDGYAKTTDLHTHDNKEVLNTITAEKVAQWDNNTGGSTSGINIVTISQADYDALKTKDANTLYLITTTNAGTVDTTNNNITLSDDLPAGTYTLKYEDENNQPLDGFDEITTLEVQ